MALAPPPPPQPLPSPGAPMVEPDGRPTPEWVAWFMAVSRRTGGALGPPSGDLAGDTSGLAALQMAGAGVFPEGGDSIPPGWDLDAGQDLAPQPQPDMVLLLGTEPPAEIPEPGEAPLWPVEPEPPADPILMALLFAEPL